ncbi:2TM domain-containing protein [Tenacibaculum xiamenense]|uniref:2TM domain-containing protein n=1 Tax=Tenacibaculum xiamenense TaxID=1261553 RepID=UPI0038950E1B
MEVDKIKIKAQERVRELKEFYQHLFVYLIINVVFTFLSNYFNIVIKIYGDLKISNKFTENGFEYYSLWGIWGVVLLIDAFRVFGIRRFLGKDWEERKIKELINKE